MEKLITRKEAAKILGISIASIFKPPWSPRARNAVSGSQADVDRWEQPFLSPPWAVHLGGAPDSLVHGLCTRNAVYSIVKVQRRGETCPSINTDKKSKKQALQMKLYQKYFANCFSPRRMLSRTRLESTPSASAISFTVIPK